MTSPWEGTVTGQVQLRRRIWSSHLFWVCTWFLDSVSITSYVESKKNHTFDLVNSSNVFLKMLSLLSFDEMITGSFNVIITGLVNVMITGLVDVTMNGRWIDELTLFRQVQNAVTAFSASRDASTTASTCGVSGRWACGGIRWQVNMTWRVFIRLYKT